MVSGKRWTDKEDATIRRLWNLGYPDDKIAGALAGRSAGAVAERRGKLGLRRRNSRKPPPSAEIEKIAKLARDGLTVDVIAERIGRSVNSVRGICHRNDITLIPRQAKPAKPRKATKPRPKGRPKPQRQNPHRKAADVSEEELERRREAAREAHERRAQEIQAAIEKANEGALGLPVVRVTRHEAAELPSWGKQNYFGHYYEVRGLTMDQCRFPVTDEPPHLFCGKPCQEDSSYCPEHSGICMTEARVPLKVLVRSVRGK